MIAGSSIQRFVFQHRAGLRSDDVPLLSDRHLQSDTIFRLPGFAQND